MATNSHYPRFHRQGLSSLRLKYIIKLFKLKLYCILKYVRAIVLSQDAQQ